MLRDYVDTPLSVEEIGDVLTMGGFEIEGIATVDGEKVLDVNIMANRGDGASTLGVARELLAKDSSAKPTALYERAQVRFEAGDQLAEDAGKLTSVDIDTESCSRYACRIFEDVKNGPSPDWLQERLKKIGLRPISLLVDLTNYVMFETGQPLHAFDLDKLAERRIVVRQAGKGERSFTTLDGEKRKIGVKDMVICDSEKPVAIAGVMGGTESEVGPETERMLLESASFDHVSVRNTRTKLGLSTDASYRFERYVDPEQVVAALNRFAELYEDATGDWSVRGVVDVYPRPPVRDPITVRMKRTAKLLGMEVTVGEAAGYLKKLGFEVEEGDVALTCTPPTWRIDVTREDDLIEEIGRIHGYEKIPELLPTGETTRGGVFGADAKFDRVREELLRCGLTQTISHSLRGLHPLDAPGKRVKVRNPHSPEIEHLRNSNLPCLADAANRNGNQNLHFFEIGRVFRPGSERLGLAILQTGGDAHEDWHKKPSPEADFYSLKGVVEKICASIGLCAAVAEAEAVDERMHPTRQAVVRVGGETVGAFGQIHPTAAESCGLPADTVVAELDLSALVSRAESERGLKTVSRNPATRRDIAVVVKKSVSYAELESAISDACGDVLEMQWLFDVYSGKGIPKKSHSLAIALQLRKEGENFTDEEANQVRDRAVQALEALGAKLR